MTNTRFELNGSEVVAVPAPKMSADEREKIYRKTAQYCGLTVPPVFMCPECFARVVGERDRVCENCVELIQQNRIDRINRRNAARLWLWLVVSAFVGAIVAIVMCLGAAAK